MKPYAAVFNTTDQCSLRCRYCFTCPNPRTSTAQVAKDAMRYIADNWITSKQIGQPSFTFFGGEPTIMWDEIIIPAAEWCRTVLDKELQQYNNISMGLSITTNGQHLTEERLLQWKALGGTFLLSIDGVPIVQDIDRPRLDGGSSSEAILKIIPCLLEHFPETTFRSTVTPYSAQWLFDSFIFAYGLGFKTYYVTPNSREHWDEKSRKTLTEHMEQIFNIHYCDMTSGQQGLKFWNWYSSFSNVLNAEVFIPITTKRCGLGTTSTGIGTQGEIFGCQEHNTFDENSMFYLGNIYTGGVDPLLSQQLLAIYSSLETPINAEFPEKCATCPLKNRCSLLFCPSANLAHNQSLNKLPDIDCFWKNLLYNNAERILQLIEEDNNHEVLEWLIQHNHLGRGECL
jgi:radical SAM protein with 4Fe4S-binding SPASM domain